MSDDPRSQPGPAAAYTRIHAPVENINVQFETHRTLGQRVADDVTSLIGSWPFIIGQSLLLAVWIAVNVIMAVAYATHRSPMNAWDPYPFILLNLALSFQSAYAGSIVLMSQNRQSQKDRLRAEQDFLVNQRAEREIEVIMQQLTYNNHINLEALQRLDALDARLAALAAALTPREGDPS